MKNTQFIYPIAMALAVTLASTGCKHTTPKTTPLPGPMAAPMGGGPETTTTIPPGPTIPQDQTPTQTPVPFQDPGKLATSEQWSPENMTEDRAALAASTVHFAFDSATVKTSEQANIQAVAAYLASNTSDKLMIEGNCDERGTEEYNRSLGERRALALREALNKLNVDAQRIRTISYGKDKPADPGHDEAAFAKNRRGDFVIYHPKTGV